MDGWINRWQDRHMDGYMDGWMEKKTGWQINEWMDISYDPLHMNDGCEQCKDGWMDEWMYRWTDGWIDKISQSLPVFLTSIFSY